MKKTGNGSADLPGRVLALACVLVFALLVAASPAWAADSGSRDMYRLYNPNSGEHFYTAKTSERDGLVRIGWNYEGVGWVAPKKSNNPVYRLYSGTDHHYTMSTAERDSLIRAGWRYEGGWLVLGRGQTGQALPAVQPKRESWRPAQQLGISQLHHV